MPVPDNLRQEAAELRDIIQRIIKKLDKHHKNKHIAAAAGSATSFVGGVLTVVGGILSIPTAGLAITLAGVGTTLAVAGGAVSLGAATVEHFIRKNKVCEVQERWERFQRDFADYCGEYAGSEEISTDIFNIARKIIGGVVEVKKGYKLIEEGIAAARAVGGSRVGSTLASGVRSVANLSKAGQVGKLAGYASKALGKAFFVTNVILIPLSLKELVESAAAAHEGEASAASAKLERLADLLDHLARDEQS